MLVMILSLFAYVSNRELANYFTYHFLIASYFGGNSVAPRNPTLFINIHGNFTLPFNLPESPTWVTLVIFFHTLKGWCLYVFYTERWKCSSQWTHKHHFPLSLKKTLGRRLFHFYQERRWSKNEKKEGFGSFHAEASVESVPTCLGEVAFTSLTYRDHILSIFQVISWVLGLYKWILHDESGGDQKKHPYDVSLKSKPEAK